MVVVDPKTAKIISAQAYDTHGYGSEVTKFATDLRNVKNGMIVAIGVKD